MTSRSAESHPDDHLLPWLHVKPEHQHGYHPTMLRMEARRGAGQGPGAVGKLLLSAWLRELRELNAVVLYDPDTPDGFYLVPRLAQDGQGMVRRPVPPYPTE